MFRLKLLSPRQQTGGHYEELACRYLTSQGLKEVARNYRCRQGELDLIMQDGAILVIVEVRYRQSAKYGSAAESVTARKQARILIAAQRYLAEHPTKQAVRFDVLVFDGAENYRWIKNAFPN